MNLISSKFRIFRLFFIFGLIVTLNSSPAYSVESINGSKNISAASKNHQQILDQVIAIVDNDIIMQSELDQRTTAIVNRLSRQGTPLPPTATIKKRVLEQLILESIQLQLADRAGIRIGDEQLNSTIQNIAKSNHMTLDQFEAQLEREGDSYANARRQIRREMTITRVQKQEVDRRVRVTEQEISNYLASKEGREMSNSEYYIGHILIALPESASMKDIAAAKEKAQKVKSLLDSGEDFEKIAVAYSDGRQALKGGVIGWRKENELPSIAAEIIPKLKIHEISKMIRTDSGFHFVTVLDKRGGDHKMIEQTNVRHILISPSEIRTDAEAKEIIDQLYDRINRGDDFASIAKAHSDDPVSAIDGGSLGWVSPGQMLPEFEQVMDGLKKDELSPPFRTKFGWHTMKVEGRRTKDLGKQILKSQAQREIYNRKFEEEVTYWRLQIRSEAFVEVKGQETNESDTPSKP